VAEGDVDDRERIAHAVKFAVARMLDRRPQILFRGASFTPLPTTDSAPKQADGVGAGCHCGTQRLGRIAAFECGYSDESSERLARFGVDLKGGCVVLALGAQVRARAIFGAHGI
jgi:hypothetical protein